MLVYLRDGSALTVACAATLREKLQIKRSVSSSRSIQTPGQPVLQLTLQGQSPGRVARHKTTGVDVPARTPPQKRPVRTVGIQAQSLALQADAFTTWPPRRQPDPGVHTMMTVVCDTLSAGFRQ